MKKVDLLIKNAAQVLTMGDGLGLIENGAVAVHDGKIVEVGGSEELCGKFEADEAIDASGKVVTPGLVDCHTHLVFAGNRENELKLRAEGKGYLEILEAGGGILSTVEATRKASKDELIANAEKWLEAFYNYGVTTVEVKSGYGLDFENEKKILEVIDELKKSGQQEIVPTFLGAHAFSEEYKDDPEKYVSEIIERMLPEFKNLAENCDLFLEKGAFSYEQADRIFAAAKKLGYEIKIHSNQINRLNGFELGKKYGALSMEHLDNISDEEIEMLEGMDTVAVLLPGSSYFLNEKTICPAKRLVDKGIPVAISTNFNPGSCPSPNLHLMMSLAVQMYDLSPEVVWPAVTINAAKALNRDVQVGSLEVGKKSNIVIWDMPNYLYPFNHFGVNFVERVLV